jgi:hypothetical protein
MVLLVVLLAGALVGCEERPRAPALTTEAVYSDSPSGLTFVAPEGWTVYAKVNLPEGRKLEYPQRMVAYRVGAGDRQGNFELFAIDLPDGKGLLEYLAGPKMALGAEKWIDKGKPTTETINGATATRYIQAGTGKGDRRRELIEFTRPDRTYVFALTYKGSDTQTREQAQRAVQSATWR